MCRKPIGICNICKKEKELTNVHNGNKICYSCHMKYFYITKECSICNEYGILYINDKETGLKVCELCYIALYVKDTGVRPFHICCVCGEYDRAYKITEKGYVCTRCYEPPKQICSICGEEDVVGKYVNKQPVCRKCYEVPQVPCSVCGTIGRVRTHIDGKPIGSCCYKPPTGQCACGHISVLRKGKCTRCYEKEQNKRDNVYIKKLIKQRVKSALKLYSKTGKIKKTDEYGINYKAIIERLGPYPGLRGEWHIDHIFPLVAFDLNNPLHILAAFAPENHQWLTAKENLSKSDSYDKVAFQAYLAKFI